MILSSCIQHYVYEKYFSTCIFIETKSFRDVSRNPGKIHEKSTKRNQPSPKIQKHGSLGPQRITDTSQSFGRHTQMTNANVFRTLYKLCRGKARTFPTRTSVCLYVGGWVISTFTGNLIWLSIAILMCYTYK